ncbi:hypothetical protein [Mycobacterium marinum]|uniref:hypothetical protein n=1 Tax=Mycobacterium marinum TaxID=1781 RepID=UPI000B97BE26|nr:hypothetical protein [Mycobacterium marinum]
MKLLNHLIDHVTDRVLDRIEARYKQPALDTANKMLGDISGALASFSDTLNTPPPPVYPTVRPARPTLVRIDTDKEGER